MSGTSWPQEQILLFLETLQAEPVIWDPNERGHKDKNKINDAWARIQEILKISIPEIKKKKESLFATYRGYRRKVEALIKSGAGVDDVYRPTWFAYEYLEKFLNPVYKCKKTITTDRHIVTGQIEPEEEEDEPRTSPTPVDAHNSMESPNSTAAQKKTTRRRFNPPELQIASKQMSEAFNNLNKVINKTAKDDNEDESDVFGKLIAKKLKKMPEHEREDLMFDILALFRRPRRVERSSSIESFPSSTSTTFQFPTYTEEYNPILQIPTTSIKLKRPKSENNKITNVAMASPGSQSSFSEPPYTFLPYSDQYKESQYILHFPKTNENGTLKQPSSNIRILSDEVVTPVENTPKHRYE